MLVRLESGAGDNHGNRNKPIHTAVPFDWLTNACAWHLGPGWHTLRHLEVISQTITEVAFTIDDSFWLFSLLHVVLCYNKINTVSFFLKVKSYSCLNFDSLYDSSALSLTQTICPEHRDRGGGERGGVLCWNPAFNFTLTSLPFTEHFGIVTRTHH